MKIAATQSAAMVVGLPDPEDFFQKTELGAENTLCSKCGGWCGHWWQPATWALGPVRHAGNLMQILRIPLVSGRGKEEVPAAVGVGLPVETVEIMGHMAPLSTVAEQVAAEGLLALVSPP